MTKIKISKAEKKIMLQLAQALVEDDFDLFKKAHNKFLGELSCKYFYFYGKTSLDNWFTDDEKFFMSDSQKIDARLLWILWFAEVCG